jgi:hypothetical protein
MGSVMLVITISVFDTAALASLMNFATFSEEVTITIAPRPGVAVPVPAAIIIVFVDVAHRRTSNFDLGGTGMNNAPHRCEAPNRQDSRDGQLRVQFHWSSIEKGFKCFSRVSERYASGCLLCHSL